MEKAKGPHPKKRPDPVLFPKMLWKFRRGGVTLSG